MRRWLRLLAWVFWDLIRHPILNVRNFKGAFQQGYDLARQGYQLDVSEGKPEFRRRVGTYTRQPDGSWKRTDG